MNSITSVSLIQSNPYETEEKAMTKALVNLVGDEMKDQEDDAIKTQKDQDAEINSDNSL